MDGMDVKGFEEIHFFLIATQLERRMTYLEDRRCIKVAG